MRLSRVQRVFLGENIGGMWSDLPSSPWTWWGRKQSGSHQQREVWHWCCSALAFLGLMLKGIQSFLFVSQLLFRYQHENSENLSSHLLLQGGREDKRGSPSPHLPINFYPLCLPPLTFTHRVYSQFAPWWLGCLHPGFCSLLQILFLLEAFVVSIAKECWSISKRVFGNSDSCLGAVDKL